eukprot:CAMPEP_0115143300 /NCGR_PEP_ID=MMETSP0227-20121206/60691_1 /TAXON_ID=89957 /ORGANISM="Polarella glacialis, Strain CCMP 1383" /LENGTH=37 /DNA_ID= /DNA_START= /DNA_END= /DNA_ORIENTATION=
MPVLQVLRSPGAELQAAICSEVQLALTAGPSELRASR